MRQFFGFLLVLFSFTSSFVYAAVTPQDANVTENVLTNLTQARITPSNVHIDTNNGITTISGVANSTQQAIDIVAITQATNDVVAVNVSSLTISTSGGQTLSDDEVMSAMVKGMFIRARLFGNLQFSAFPVNIKSYQGIVYLTGTVNNQQQMVDAIKLTWQVKGVTRVISTMQVRAERVRTG